MKSLCRCGTLFTHVKYISFDLFSLFLLTCWCSHILTIFCSPSRSSPSRTQTMLKDHRTKSVEMPFLGLMLHEGAPSFLLTLSGLMIFLPDGNQEFVTASESSHVFSLECISLHVLNWNPGINSGLLLRTGRQWDPEIGHSDTVTISRLPCHGEIKSCKVRVRVAMALKYPEGIQFLKSVLPDPIGPWLEGRIREKWVSTLQHPELVNITSIYEKALHNLL